MGLWEVGVEGGEDFHTATHARRDTEKQEKQDTVKARKARKQAVKSKKKRNCRLEWL